MRALFEINVAKFVEDSKVEITNNYWKKEFQSFNVILKLKYCIHITDLYIEMIKLIEVKTKKFLPKRYGHV